MPKKWWFESDLSKFTRLVTAIKSLRFALFVRILDEIVITDMICNLLSLNSLPHQLNNLSAEPEGL